MTSQPARLVAIGIYDNRGTLIRRVDVKPDGTFEPFDVKANEMVYSILDLGDGSAPSIAPWQTSHRPALPGNRWAAFTTDELVALDESILVFGQEDGSAGEHMPQVFKDLQIEIGVELERRKP